MAINYNHHPYLNLSDFLNPTAMSDFVAPPASRCSVVLKELPRNRTHATFIAEFQLKRDCCKFYVLDIIDTYLNCIIIG